MRQFSDQAISASSSQDEGDSFEALIESHQQVIYFFIRSMVFNPDDAKDTLQDVNVVLWRKKGAFQSGTNFKAWAFTIARFECLTYLSRYKNNKLSTLDTGLLESIADTAEEKSDDVDPWLRALHQCMQGLSEEARMVVDSRYQQSLPLEKTAQKLQTSVGAIKQKLFRARKQLKQCITAHLRAEKNAELVKK
jgi:RNA polymerase sigma-70 factor (ECF subfamily)